MQTSVHARAVDRELLSAVFTDVSKADAKGLNLDQLPSVPIPDHGALIGYWGDQHSDPFPDFLIVRDADLKDTFAWLSSYFSGVAPITQWCRICTESEMRELIKAPTRPSVGNRLGVWVGAVLAECSAQANYNINLKELPGTAALTSATFAAARAVAVWGGRSDLVDLARRHEEMYTRLREGGRPIAASALLPIWHVIQRFDSPSKFEADRRALEPLGGIIENIVSRKEIDAEFIQQVVLTAASHFDLPELVECARGPQPDRLKALDQLARELGPGTKSPAIQALLGFGASLIDPGAAVLPELLRKYLGAFPLAPIWLGVFAGAWSPIRVLTDQQGLGRIIAKSILADSDLQSKPSCDIAFEEISRWLGSDPAAAKISLRGMAARSINIELIHGVTCPFAIGRLESYRSETHSAAAPARTETQENSKPRATATVNPQITAVLDLLARRLDVVERTIAQMQEITNSGPGRASQTDLLGDSVTKPPDTKHSKKSRWRR